MKKRFLVFIFLLMIVICPKEILAKEYSASSVNRVLSEGDSIVFDSDFFEELSNNYYGCVSLEENCCSVKTPSIWMDINLDGTNYIIRIREVSLNDKGVFIVPKISEYFGNSYNIDYIYVYNMDNTGNTMTEVSEEEINLIKERILNLPLKYSVSIREGTASCSTYININYSDEEDIFDLNSNYFINLDYFNLNNSKNDNPVGYVKEDGTVVLKKLERDGYKFEGWYLDKNFQYRITELSLEFVRDYFSDMDQFGDIDRGKIELRDDDTYVGNIKLYAKWSSNNKISNPKTFSTIGVVVGVIALLGVACSVIFINKKKKNDGE